MLTLYNKKKAWIYLFSDALVFAKIEKKGKKPTGNDRVKVPILKRPSLGTGILRFLTIVATSSPSLTNKTSKKIFKISLFL